MALFSLSGDNGVDTSEGRESTTGERMAASRDRKTKKCNALNAKANAEGKIMWPGGANLFIRLFREKFTL